MTRLLLIDDDPSLLEILSDYLSRSGYEVETAATGSAGLRAARTAAPDLVLLDVAMPGLDGWQVLRSLRETSTVPVIMLTARSDEPEILQGFALGADDYVMKPFSFAQLEARIRAVLARTAGVPGEDTRRMAAGDLQVDLDAHRVRKGKDVIKLTPTEFRLLVALMEQPGKVLSPVELVRKVWGEQYSGESEYVRRYVWHLRRKLEDNPEAPKYIQNERNVGYYFAVQ
jgi:two-component system KDP operon response regulator KdpE